MADITVEFVWSGIRPNFVWCCFIAAISLKIKIDFMDNYVDPCST
jgi:hypothetical protein